PRPGAQSPARLGRAARLKRKGPARLGAPIYRFPAGRSRAYTATDMAACRRWIFIVFLLLAAVARAAAASASGEQHAFEAAARELKQGFYEQAEKDFKAFAEKYPNSSRLSEAILGQAQALLKQTNYSAAVQLLNARQSNAGTNADQYVFWKANAHYSNGDYEAAAEDSAKLAKEFPTAPRRLEAVIQEATARARLADWGRVLELQTNAVWQSAT